MDPLEFRLRNYAEVEPISGEPFSFKALRECYPQGAAHFGWQGRPLASRRMGDESGYLVGWGLGTATFPAIMFRGQGQGLPAVRRDWPHRAWRSGHGPGRLGGARADCRRLTAR